MAVTKLLRIKETGGRNAAHGLERNLKYICDSDKTDGGRNIGGNAGRSHEAAYQTMIMNKQLWGKTDKTQGFHYILSFDPAVPVSIQTAHAVAKEFCDELLQGNYYYLYAIHDDREHLHIHVTFDSVSMTDGKKFHSPKGDWERRIQPITDRLCRKYDLPTLQYTERKRSVDYGEWRHREEAKRGAAGNCFTWHDVIRDDVDEAIAISADYAGFLQALRKMRYVVRDGKYLSLRPYGKEKAVRTGRLGKGYGKEEIMERIAGKIYEPAISHSARTYGNAQEIRDILYYKVCRSPGWHMSPFQRQFYRRWRRTYLIRQPQLRDAWKYKRDIIQVQKMSDSIRYMTEHDIRDEGQARRRRQELEEEQSSLKARQAAISSQLYRNEVFKNLREYQKIMAQGKETISPAEWARALELKRRIDERMPFDEACSRLRYFMNERSKLKAAQREGKREMKRLMIVEQLFSDPIHPKEGDDYYASYRKELLQRIQGGSYGREEGTGRQDDGRSRRTDGGQEPSGIRNHPGREPFHQEEI